MPIPQLMTLAAEMHLAEGQLRRLMSTWNTVASLRFWLCTRRATVSKTVGQNFEPSETWNKTSFNDDGDDDDVDDDDGGGNIITIIIIIITIIIIVTEFSLLTWGLNSAGPIKKPARIQIYTGTTQLHKQSNNNNILLIFIPVFSNFDLTRYSLPPLHHHQNHSFPFRPSLRQFRAPIQKYVWGSYV
jgi:hypothetical protein